ncbi:MAG: lysophospholipid acyltransferase family protein [Ornithinimicrobium sp.]
MTVRPAALALWRPEITGAENVPSQGPVILASNHLSFADSVAIPLVSPRQVSFLAKSDYFTGTGLSGWISKTWFTSIGSIPVNRDHARSAQESLDVALRHLQGGGVFGIYPEGTRSRDGRLYHFRAGVAWLALHAQCPVVPVALGGTAALMPVGARVPRVKKFTVQFGTPIDVVGRFDGVPAGKARRLVADEIYQAVLAMGGQEEAGEYTQRQPDAP